MPDLGIKVRIVSDSENTSFCLFNAYNSLYFHPWVIASALKSDPKLYLHNKLMFTSYREKIAPRNLRQCNFLCSSSMASIINK